ncbi:MAG: YggS family pyridoxal phosphate-dependent enzyme [Spirochaetales bacterium]|nr:YggS family pyridoxal phosphate-dependent enzyme [Spirochaetales bacterium]
MAIADNLKEIKDNLNRTALGCGRDPQSIRLLPVSKRKPLEALLEAHEAGENLFGENRVDEALEKLEKLPRGVQVDMIGHLQSNKAAKTAGKFRLIHSVDSLKLAARLDRANGAIGNVQDILIELNTSGEESKSGYTDCESLLKDLEEMVNMKNICLKGFMTMAPFIEERDLIRRTFVRCREWRDEAQKRFPDQDFSELSMGMSGDYVEAIEEGATIIRVGTAIFGARQY